MWAITGTGVLSSIGTGVCASFAALCRAESGLGPLRAFDPSRYRIRRAFEVPDGPDRPGRASRWLGMVIAEAVARAGIAPGPRVPVLVGTGLAEQRSVELWWTSGATMTRDRLHFAGEVARRFGPVPTLTFVNACAAGLYALAVGTDLLALDEADAVVVAGTDALTESMFGLLDRVTPEPPAEVRPFDEDRRGVILGEGAAAVVLEPVEHARARGATVLALLRGVGTSCDAHHVTAPLREGIGRALRDGYGRSDVDPVMVDAILAHGTGTVLNDETEALALQDAYRGARRRPVLTSLKAAIGHTSGASGLMSVVTAVEAMARRRVPPTLHHTTPIRALAGFPVVTTRRARPLNVRTAQVNAFGFGGVNAVALLSRSGRAIPRPAAPTVVVTGAGLAASGLDSAATLLNGHPCGAGPFDPRTVLGAHGLRYKDRATVLALSAVARALADAGLPTHATSPPDADFGVVLASELAVLETVCRTASVLHADGVRATSPMDLPNASGNVAASSIAIRYGLAGLNLNVSAGPSSGVDALYLAACAIRAGRARRVVVVGVEPAGPVAERLTPDEVRLFDGAAAVVLESEPAARDRNARPRAVVDRYRRDHRLHATVGDRPGLWLVPCGRHSDGMATGLDLSRDVGEAGAALGVLQAAAAVSWLADHPGDSALLSSGGCWGGDYASLTLRGVPA